MSAISTTMEGSDVAETAPPLVGPCGGAVPGEGGASPGPAPGELGSTGPLVTVPYDWSKTLALVERAAFTIKDYEVKFIAIERDTRTFIRRVKEEQQRAATRVADLDRMLAEAQERAQAAEKALAAAAAEMAGMRLENEAQRQRLVAAQAETEEARSRLRRMEGALRLS